MAARPAPSTTKQAATAIIMGLADQSGNEIDEFVSETLRNHLLGLPLDLPAINMTRARSEGIPPLNEVRRQIFADTNDGQLAPYTNWIDFREHEKHPESLVNFVAAYGTHPAITAETTLAGRRTAADRIVNGTVLRTGQRARRRSAHRRRRERRRHQPARRLRRLRVRRRHLGERRRHDRSPASTTSTSGSAAWRRTRTCSAASSARRSTTCSRTSSPTSRTATGSTTSPAPRA